MEQVRVAMAWIAKYHFWLLSVLVILISSLVWMIAASDLKGRKTEYLKTIENAFKAQDDTARKPLLPSDEVLRKQQEQISSLVSETRAIWQVLYDRQRQKVLKWPPQLPSSFRRHVGNKQFGDEIDKNYREQYATYIRGRFEDLPKIINANDLDKSSTAGGGGGRGGRGSGRESGRGGGFGGFGGFGGTNEVEFDEEGNPKEVDYTVFWSPDDQQRIAAELDWPTADQSHWRIWVTQEDLWVYETMLRAIAAVNETKGAERQSSAAITDLATLQVGRDAASESRTRGRITRLAPPVAGQPEAEDRMGEESGGRGGRGGGFDGRGGEISPDQEKAIRLSGRYIDGEGLPISVPPDEEPLDRSVFGQEMKRLPVRMMLRMDDRWLPLLITELANADLQIKVTEVRVGVDPEGSGGGGGGRGGRGGGDFGGRGARGGFGGGDGAIQVFDRKPFMKSVIIQGVVLIFNPPDKEILGDESDESLDPGVVSR